MKKIAVLVHSLIAEYPNTVVSGICDYFKDKDDVILMITQTREPHYSEGLYEYQYWANSEYLKSDWIDGVIVVTNSYVYNIQKDEITKLFQPYSSKKMVSVGSPLPYKKSKYTVCKVGDVYDQIVGHLIKEHGRKDIAFFSADKTGSLEALERLEGFKNALKKHNLEFHEDWVLQGNFTHGMAEWVFNHTFTSKDQIKFDSIVCANDLMAVAVTEGLMKLGVRVPDDVCVVGFDNSSYSRLCTPSLTTVDQQVFQQGFMAADVLYKELCGEKVPQCVNTPLEVIYRNSCGCDERLNKDRNITLQLQLDYYRESTRVDNVLDLIRSSVTLDGFASSFNNIISPTGFDALHACILDHPIPIRREDLFTLPKRAQYFMKIDSKKDIAQAFENGCVLKPKTELFPEKDIGPGNYLFQPIYLDELQYGYIMVRVNLLNNFAANSINLKIISSILAQDYDYTQTMKVQQMLEQKNITLQESNENLDIQAKTDELTKILNRRGFYEYGQECIDFTLKQKNTGLVFFADLDGLKSINDTYGHDIGDAAIRTVAQVLRKCFRQSDIVGRLSGDEFAIVAPGMTVEGIYSIKKKILSFNKKISKENNLPFVVSVSIGAVSFGNGKKDVHELLKLADEFLYEEKRLKHARN